MQRNSWLVLLFIVHFNTCADNIVIGTSAETLQKFQILTKHQKCSEITQFEVKDITRKTVELVLICQALSIEGLGHLLTFVEMPNYSRTLMQSKKGEIDIPSETIWFKDISSSDFYVSDAVIENGEYELGVFIRPDRIDLLTIEDAQDLSELVAVSSINWSIDWALLTQLKVKKYSTSNVLSMFKMVEIGRADFTLYGFGLGQDFQSEINGITLTPIPNVKIILEGSRHFVVSKRSKNSKRIYQSLQKGLKVLRRQEMVRKAYTEAGFFSDVRDNWKVLNLP